MTLHPDLREFIALLNSKNVEYVVVGVHALAFHGVPRYTGDLDMLVRACGENAARLVDALTEFGLTGLGLTVNDFLESGSVVQIGHAPNRVDLLTALTGVTFEEVWAERDPGQLDQLPVFFLSRRLFLKNKQALGRPKDLADIAFLEGL